jgi:hypothetical protein
MKPRVKRRINYLDLDVAISSSSFRNYKVRILNSPAGQTGDHIFELPWSNVELENLLVRMRRSGRVVRHIDTPEVAAMKTLGSKLYESIFYGQLEVILLRSLSEAAALHSGLRIRLRLTDAPELSGLPWELLYDRIRNRFLCLSDRTPLVRFFDVSDPPRPLSLDSALRVLVVISAPHGVVALDADEEWARLTEALAPLLKSGSVELQRLEVGSVSALRSALRRDEWHVLHFIGHGRFDAAIGDGVLLFEGPQRRSRLVSGQDLDILLHDHDSLRLVVLNACEGSRSNPNDAFSGTAQALIQQGIPAVVAMQTEVSDTAAIAISSEMYVAIADGYSLEGALADARKAVYTDGNQTEWATPVLYLRTSGADIFEVRRQK